MFSGTCTPINDIHAPPYTGSMHLAFIMAILQFSIVRSVNFDVLLIAVHTHNTYIFCCPKSVSTAMTLISSRG